MIKALTFRVDNVEGNLDYVNNVALPGQASDRARGDAALSNRLLGACPVGGVIMWWGNSSEVPAGWLLCDGSTFDTNQYPELAEVMGGGTNLRVPNLIDRVPRGHNAQPARPGALSGADTVTLAVANLPSHAHSMTHGHTIAARNTGGQGNNPDRVMQATGNQGPTTNSAPNDFTGNTGSTGGGAAVDIRPRACSMWFILRAAPA